MTKAAAWGGAKALSGERLGSPTVLAHSKFLSTSLRLSPIKTDKFLKSVKTKQGYKQRRVEHPHTGRQPKR